jgi:hypothetical protein
MERTANLDRDVVPSADFHDIVAALVTAPHMGPTLAATALAHVCRGVMTGEGPTARGRIHFSRTIDREDVAWCERILVSAAGPAEHPISRAEADALFDIYNAACEHEDGGRFNDLFVKAIAHHVLSALGHAVPPRVVALAAGTSLATWIDQRNGRALDQSALTWLETQLSRMARPDNALAPLSALLAPGHAVRTAPSLVSVVAA